MATFLDEERFDENSLEEGEELNTFEQEEEVLGEEVEQEEESQPEDDLPDKYRGKTPAEIAKMHQEAEKLLGRQSSEVGELRKIVDDFVKSQLETKTTQSEEDDDVDWYSDPDKAVQRAINNHPKLKKAEEVSEAMYRQQAAATLQAKHPDMQDILGDPSFGEWVQSSKVRMRLFKEADQSYDVESADELLSMWKERQSYTKQAVQTDKADRKRKVREASTGSASGSAEPSSRKIYRRADIIKLMQTDPDRYMSMADEIAQAYAEKRVR